MWYFSWILGTGFALAFGVLNAMWYEVTEAGEREQSGSRADQPTGIPEKDS